LNEKTKKIVKMKKTVKMIGMACLLGAFAFLGSSCKKNNNDTTSVKMTMPVVTVTNIDDSKAYIDYSDGNKMKWNADDQIMYYNLAPVYTKSVRNVFTLYQGIDEYQGYFSGGVMGASLAEGNPNLGFYAFYPASKVEAYELGPNNSQEFEVPASQNYNEDCMDPTSLVMAAKGFAPNEGGNFKHIFGFANLRLKGTRKVERIIITDNKFNLNGNITIDLPAVNSDALSTAVNDLADNTKDYTTTWNTIEGLLHGEGSMNYTSDPGDKTMTLECGGIQLKSDQYTNFIVSLRPGALHQGFTVTVEYTSGTPASETFYKYNPDNAGYAFGTRLQYPRGFCVKPGNLMNYNVN
jgi:hypothetical protein